MSLGRNRAFTLIEGLVAAAILAIGVVGTLSGFGSLARIEARARETEQLQMLALDKYDELISTSTLPVVSQSGDFTDHGLNGISWRLDIAQTSVQDLNSAVVTVTVDSDPTHRKAVATGLLFAPASQATGATTP